MPDGRRIWLSSAVVSVMLLASSGGAQPIQARPQTAFTGEPEAPLGICKQIEAQTEADYRKALADRTTKDPLFVPIKRTPPGLSSSARFGVDFPVDGHHCSWILDGDAQHGYVMYVDLNGNGDLTDDKPLRFEKQNDISSCLLRVTAHDVERDAHQTYPLVLKLEVADLLAPGETQPRPYLSIHAMTVRRGVAHVGHKDVLFSIRGVWGLYDDEASVIFFDLNGDGQLDGADPFSPPHDSLERFRLSDKYVNIEDTSYEFTVDRYGRSVTLTPLATKLAERATLLPNSPAPEFAFTGIDGKTHRLSDYRGKVVLLDFWGTWCSPCVAAAPKLAEAYEKYRARGFEIIGVDAGDSEERLRSFVAEKKLTWVNTREEESGAIHRLYRVVAWPSYVLIDRDGRIVATGMGGRNLLPEVEKSLDKVEK